MLSVLFRSSCAFRASPMLEKSFLRRISRHSSSVNLKEEVDPGVVNGLQIFKYPAPTLRAHNEEITEFNDELKALTRRMFDIMYEAEGVGLAAPLVGINKRLMVYNELGDPQKWMSEMILVNPKIVERSSVTVFETEGCLSFPGMNGPVERSTWIKVEAMNLKGKKFRKKFVEWEARIFQHEYDHLEGVVYIDHLDDESRSEIQPVLDELIEDFGPDGVL